MKNVFVALQDIRSLYNVGALFRTCSFFGFENIILVGYSGKVEHPQGADTLHPKISKTALGSEKNLNILLLRTDIDLVNFCSENNLSLVSVEQSDHSICLSDFKLENNFVLVFGNEVTGVSEAILQNSTVIVEIPRSGKHNSLNVTTACGVVLYSITN